MIAIRPRCQRASWERLDRVSNDPFAGLAGFAFRGCTNEILRNAQQELGEMVGEYVATGGGLGVAGKLIVRIAIPGIPDPEVRSRIVAGALELTDDTGGGQAWATQILRGEALRASSLSNEQVFLPQPTSPVPGLRPQPSP